MLLARIFRSFSQQRSGNPQFWGLALSGEEQHRAGAAAGAEPSVSSPLWPSIAERTMNSPRPLPEGLLL
ncbi:MAG: hypothetical protein CM15mP116_03750 [Synechococcus sp.]|nr:MAG: hypothetical protein CM15mP116_03750 [Synechococcus sp.]